MVRQGSDQRSLDGLPIEIVHGDLTEPASLADAMAGVDTLFNVAARYDLSRRARADAYQANVDGTRNLMLAALRAPVDRVVHTSSVAAVGPPGLDPSRPADESQWATVEDTPGPYEETKILSGATSGIRFTRPRLRRSVGRRVAPCAKSRVLAVTAGRAWMHRPHIGPQAHPCRSRPTDPRIHCDAALNNGRMPAPTSARTDDGSQISQTESFMFLLTSIAVAARSNIQRRSTPPVWPVPMRSESATSWVTAGRSAI